MSWSPGWEAGDGTGGALGRPGSLSGLQVRRHQHVHHLQRRLHPKLQLSGLVRVCSAMHEIQLRPHAQCWLTD